MNVKYVLQKKKKFGGGENYQPDTFYPTYYARL
jgi:hypothetical protein